MGNVRSYSSTPVHRSADFEQISWEVESKITLLNHPPLKDPIITEHRFFFDKDDNYLFSLTDNRRYKRKSEELVLTINGIQVFVRKEELKPPITSLPKEVVGFRMGVRRRVVYALAGYMVSIDELSVDSKSFFQLEVEGDAPKSVEDTFEVLRRTAELTHQAIAKLPAGVTVEFISPSKADWLQQNTVINPIVRGVKGWIQRLML